MCLKEIAKQEHVCHKKKQFVHAKGVVIIGLRTLCRRSWVIVEGSSCVRRYTPPLIHPNTKCASTIQSLCLSSENIVALGFPVLWAVIYKYRTNGLCLFNCHVTVT